MSEAAGSLPRRAGRRRLVPSATFGRFVARRAIALVFLAIGITLVVFLLTQLVPSDPVTANLGEQAAGDPAAVAAFKEHYGLDKPLPERYLIYLGHVVRGDLGESALTHNPVTTDLGQFIPATAELALFSIVIAILVGIPIGVAAAVKHDKPVDHALRVVSLGGISMPTFWIALVALYVFFFRLGWFPGGGRLDPGTLDPPHVTGFYTIDALFAGQWGVAGEAFHHLVLPALVLAAFNVSLLDALHALGRARGDGERLRARGPREGPPGADRPLALRPACGAPGGHHRDRAALREHPHRRRARREHLRLARARAVRLPGRRSTSTCPRSRA